MVDMRYMQCRSLGNASSSGPESVVQPLPMPEAATHARSKATEQILFLCVLLNASGLPSHVHGGFSVLIEVPTSSAPTELLDLVSYDTLYHPQTRSHAAGAFWKSSKPFHTHDVH